MPIRGLRSKENVVCIHWNVYHMVENYSALKKKKELFCETMWIDLEVEEAKFCINSQ